jgi:hypothetical protein
VYLCSAAIAVAAAALCLVLPAFHMAPVWIFGIAMMLAAVANQAIYPASQDGSSVKRTRMSGLWLSALASSS